MTSTTAAAFPGVRQILWTTRKKQDIIKNATARIIARHPDAPLTLVARVVAEEYDQLASSPIRTYTPMLIERGAPKRINKEFAAHPADEPCLGYCVRATEWLPVDVSHARKIDAKGSESAAHKSEAGRNTSPSAP